MIHCKKMKFDEQDTNFCTIFIPPPPAAAAPAKCKIFALIVGHFMAKS